MLRLYRSSKDVRNLRLAHGVRHGDGVNSWQVRPIVPDAGGPGRFLGKGGGEKGTGDATAALAGMGQHVRMKHPAALPVGAQHLVCRRLYTLMGVRDHQLDAAKAAARELA